ncbi:MAG: MoxR family ATPase [SAR324 cluster bacterium]|uniref:MoxR family ATPase n=1 Tax=SAR324 cluster bacterium TaxID=2024889 RepID=A0A7X9ILI6_9DELT|nr:MoxR family ATPase [SAR324 cluster bacterium]
MAPSNEFSSLFKNLKTEVGRVIVGQDTLVERLMIALLSNGHILVEGVPGLAKTKILSTLTSCINAKMTRIQFTPDLLPSDVLGTEIFRPQSGEFVVRKGPIFTNFLLADEINRAPAKVQSALLQAMQEREVSIGETTFRLPEPFLVFATQNPIEQEGTYPLPEAQIDRFLMKVKTAYPSFHEEVAILDVTSREDIEHISVDKVCTLDELLAARKEAMKVFIDPRIDGYIVSLVQASRNSASVGLQGMVDWGASPRASIALKSCARSLAFIRGLNAVTSDHVKEVAPDVLRHRILTSFDAESRGLKSEDIIRVILEDIPVP